MPRAVFVVPLAVSLAACGEPEAIVSVPPVTYTPTLFALDLRVGDTATVQISMAGHRGAPSFGWSVAAPTVAGLVATGGSRVTVRAMSPGSTVLRFTIELSGMTMRDSLPVAVR